ncbi:BRCA2 and CDKN1A-interacting protein-like [Metopolophium dirhodum]|uniref:BRCA2 and CDKN1A-interacting protein-like n=1 Tax=Metopolophium dirhodum TaxID=44670 RepID=UPI00298F5A4B|nr:BRCA2 and CDKN1A-interacting protein-like [Metopolophium dirhodum]
MSGDVRIFNIKFAIRYPKYSDFNSIKRFLLQLFLKVKVDLPDMSSELIKQSNISIVIKQAFDSVKCKDNLNTSYNQVFGISSIINITQQRSESIANVHNLMLILSEKHGDNGTMQFVNKLLSDDKNQVGFLINERYLNIPPSISGPLFRIICKELSNKRTENPLNNFAYLFMICKLYKVEKSKKGNIYVEGSQILWRNAEEQFFDIVADYKFEYCVQSENCTDPAGKWVELNNSRMIPFRRVLIFSMNKFFLVTKKLESLSAPKVIKRHSAYSPD